MTARDSGGVSSALKRDVVAYYEDVLRRHGPSAQGVDWKDEHSQTLRFELLSGVCDLEGRSVHEIGAGVGHLWDYLRERSPGVDYSGSDLSQAMVDAARARHPDISFERRDLLNDPLQHRYDVVMCSGLFHVKLHHTDDEWRAFVYATVEKMFEMCRVGIAFNTMSDHVDFRSDTLFYANAGEVLDFCRRKLSRFVTLRHDYPLYESTVYVYREDAKRRAPTGAL
jgi:2-polyprenyl-3-methyl-5-hydroxy-6-metoxy-1,4-benzoquinol methylase